MIATWNPADKRFLESSKKKKPEKQTKKKTQNFPGKNDGRCK